MCLRAFNSTDFVNQVVGFAATFNVDYLEASSLHYAPKLKVRLGAVKSVRNPLDSLQTPLLRVPLRK